MAKKRRTITHTPHTAHSSSFSVLRFGDRPWLPVLLFLLIAFAYYADPFLNNKGFNSTEYAGHATSSGITRIFNPFNGSLVWSEQMGGLTAGDQVLEYTRNYTYALLSLILPVDHKVVAAYQMLLLIFAGTSLYLYLRLIGIGKPASTIFAVCYELSPMLLSLDLAFHQSKQGVMALMPFMFYGVERIFQFGRIKDVLILCAAMVAVLYTGHLQMVYFSYIGIGLYVVFRLGALMRSGATLGNLARTVLYCAVAMLLAMMINARGLLPQYENATQVSKRAAQTQATNNPEADAARKQFTVTWSLHPEEVASLLVPEFSGYDVRKGGNWLNRYWGRNPFKINVEYFGLLPVVLAVAALAGMYHHAYVLFFGALGLFGILFGLGAHTPVHGILASLLPGISSLRGPGMMTLLTAFSACVMGATAVQALTHNPEGQDYRKSRKLEYATLGVIAMLLLTGAMATESLLSIWIRFLSYMPEGTKLQAFKADVPLLSRACFYATLLLSVTIAVLWARQAGKVSTTVVLIVLICCSIIDSWRVGRQFLSLTGPNHTEPTTVPQISAFEWIKEHDDSKFRIIPAFDPQSRLRYPGIIKATGQHDFTILRYDILLQNLNYWGIFNVGNVKYIVHTQPLQLPGWPQVYHDDQFLIYENPNVYPFVYVATSAIVKTEEKDILDLLRDPQQRFTNTVILEEPADPSLGISSVPIEAKTDVQVRRFDIEAGRYEFEVTSDAPGVLVVSDNYHPDWVVSVNGAEQPVLHANYFWKGVAIPAGTSSVEFRFTRPMITLSARLSVIGLLIFGAALTGVVVASIRNRRTRPMIAPVAG